jgi:hypothetical protein
MSGADLLRSGAGKQRPLRFHGRATGRTATHHSNSFSGFRPNPTTTDPSSETSRASPNGSSSIPVAALQRNPLTHGDPQVVVFRSAGDCPTTQVPSKYAALATPGKKKGPVTRAFASER